MTTTMFIVAVLFVFAAGAAIWAWFSIAEVEEQLRSFSGFDEMHFEIGPRATEGTGGAR